MTDWENKLDKFFANKEVKEKETATKLSVTETEVPIFIEQVVMPAFRELRPALERHGREVAVFGGQEPRIVIKYNGQEEFEYAIHIRVSPGHAVPVPKTRRRDKKDGKLFGAEGYLRSGTQDYSISEITKDEIIEHFLSDYMGHIAHSP